MQPEHRGYSRCSDFFMCVRHGAHESAALTIINVDAAPPPETRSPRRLPKSGRDIIIFGKIAAILSLSKLMFTKKLLSPMISW